MPVDASPAESARSLLNGIDYSALIGGPLQAAIAAQAMAAKSTWEFIQEVGLNKDADGMRSAINVTFLYQRDGEMVKLIVPILTIVPIPLIVVDLISIDFTANINASASSTKEDSSSQDIAGELEAESKIGWGPFSLTARMKASYSSKQSSKATQDSRYSVEYTQAVKVQAKQADMPAGLATVLNILSAAATGGSKDGELTVSPALATVDESNPTPVQLIEIRTRDSKALNVKSEVILSLPAAFENCFQLYSSPGREKINWTKVADRIQITVNTSPKGVVSLYIGPGTIAVPPSPPAPPVPILTISSLIKGDKDPQEVVVPIKVIPALAAPALVLTPSPIKLTGTTPAQVSISGPLPDAANVTVTLTGDTAVLSFPPTVTLGANGKGSADISYKQGKSETVQLRFSAAAGGVPLETSLTVQPVTPALQLSAHQPVAALNAVPSSATQTWTVLMHGQEAPRQPVRVNYDPKVVSVRHAGKPLASGDTLPLDDRNMARLEFEVAAGAVPGQSQVILESEVAGSLMQKIIPVQVA